MKKIVIALLCVLSSYSVLAVEWVNGEIVRIDTARNRIVMKHEYIPSIKMHAMTMPFGISNGLNVEPYKPGDKVRFQIKVVDGTLDITTMEKLK
ncbi:MAG: copper-binding protein [Polynucleobacter sp.]|nr:copper-binding protein [Polynucleobacter sp.]